MKTEDKLQIGKFIFMLINSFFVILGISLFGSSLWILFDKSNVIAIVSNEEDVKVVAGGLFVIGLVVVVVSMLGCIGVHAENRCFLAFYMGLLIAIFFGELFVTFLLLIKRNKIETFLAQTVDTIIGTYGVNDTQPTWSLLDSVQQSAKCCGRQNASDWRTNEFIKVQNISDIYPCSCFSGSCPVFFYQFGNGTDIYKKGCEEQLKDWFGTNVLVIVGMDLALLLIQILQCIMACLIFRNIGAKMNNRHPENLLNVMEESPEVPSNPQENDLQYYQPSEQQMYDAYNQEPTGQYEDYQYHDAQHQPNISPHAYDQGWNDEYENAGQSYDQYHRQVYQDHHDPYQSGHEYNQEDGFRQQYAGASANRYQEQYDQYERDPHHGQHYNASYNQGYVRDEYRNNFENY
ncbi:tetraspanin-19 isoform 1-T2 [Clarias gariepinus]|uniref:tetraspanin-19 n=1 Tax=Clarias gariepinus TaxID=13013 RepID=UPI00234D4D93|nr:tetraspanin-19 [Clarias gariepinus]XP_053364921.1 tetraspanin-19 [Clarias gariepinus]